MLHIPALTKEELINRYHITNVDPETGKIYGARGTELKQDWYKGVKKHKHSTNNNTYLRIQVQDFGRSTIATTTKQGYNFMRRRQKTLFVHRVVYAWVWGECPKDLQINHIDHNREHNYISNLEATTQDQNLADKVVSRNQYTWMLSDEEILALRKSKRYIYDRNLHQFVDNPDSPVVKKKAAKQKIQEQLNELGQRYSELKNQVVVMRKYAATLTRKERLLYNREIEPFVQEKEAIHNKMIILEARRKNISQYIED